LIATLIVLDCSGCAISLLGGPKFDPALNWNVIPTPHFRVYFHQGEEELAQKAARIAEEVHSILVPRLGWEPAEPTQLVLVDNDDLVADAATPFPNNTIYIGLTPPLANPLPFPERYDDWFRDVITHEYVHILQLDMNTGFPAMMRTIFGRQPIPFVIFNSGIPNILQPDWLIEGLATFEETATGVSDRGDNAYTEMLLRMAILEDRFPTLDQAGGIETWPDNQIQYLFGAGFLHYLVQRYGERVLKELNLNYSDRVVPFFVGMNGEQVLGETYGKLWNDWKSELTYKFEQQRKELGAAGLTKSRPVTRRGDYVLGPRTNPNDGRIAYTRVNPKEYPSIHLMDPQTGEDGFLLDRNYAYTVSWSSDGQKIAFSQLEIYRNYSVYSDLYIYDLSSKKTRRLTTGARLRDPDFHPDGNRLVCVENRLGRNRLIIYDLTTGRSEALDWADTDMIWLHPRWSPDGHLITASVWKNGAQGLALVDLEHREIRTILMDSSLDLTPTWSPAGDYLLFSSERTGVYNLFAFSLKSSKLFQVTNVLGGAFTPEVTPDGQGILFSGYTSRGFDLYRMPWDPTAWRKVGIEVWIPLPGSMIDPDLADKPKGSPYSPWPTFRPRFWTPIFGSDESGAQVGVATGGMDVLGKHKLEAAALYGTTTHRPAYSLQYVNDYFYPSIHVGMLDLPIKHSDLPTLQADQTYSYWERQQRFNLDANWSRDRFQTNQSLSFGYQFEGLSRLTDIPNNAVPPDEGDLSGVRLVWRFNSAHMYGFSISPEDGRRLLASYQRFDRRLGSDFDQNRYIASWHEYLGLFFPQHVLAARLTGGLATGDSMIQGDFQVGGPSVAEEILDPEQIDFFLRGYPQREFIGRKAAVGTLEYRFPLQNIERGHRTWPFFFQRTHADLFFDIGNAWDKDTTLSDFHRGIGVEFEMDTTLGYLLPVRFRLGFAKGLDQEGENQTYFVLGNSF
jgi:Tol biopolymer transport system component